MEPRRHTLPVPNATDKGKHELVFYDWGDVNAARTVICVHGLTRNAHDFDVIAEALVATGRRVFSLNMAGRGESAWLTDPMGYNYAAYVADCIAVMDNVHLRGVEWIGTSMGGIIGMMIAANYPRRIRKLVLNDIGMHLSKESLTRIYSYVTTMPPSFPDRAAADAYLAETFKPFGITDPALWEKFVDHSLLKHAEAGMPVRLACDPAIAAPLRAATKDFTEVNDVSLTEIWDEVDIPTLILHGADSDILSTDTITAMRKSNPRAETITFPGVGHAPPLMTDAQIRPVLIWLGGSNAMLRAAGL